MNVFPSDSTALETKKDVELVLRPECVKIRSKLAEGLGPRGTGILECD